MDKIKVYQESKFGFKSWSYTGFPGWGGVLRILGVIKFLTATLPELLPDLSPAKLPDQSVAFF